MPPKPPLLIISTWSPGRASATQLADQFVEVVEHVRLGAQRRERLGGVPAEVGAVAVDQVGVGEAARAAALSSTPSFMVLERGSSTARMRAVADLAPQAFERGGDRGGVVGEVVVDGDAAAPRRALPCAA